MESKTVRAKAVVVFAVSPFLAERLHEAADMLEDCEVGRSEALERPLSAEEIAEWRTYAEQKANAALSSLADW